MRPANGCGPPRARSLSSHSDGDAAAVSGSGVAAMAVGGGGGVGVVVIVVVVGDNGGGGGGGDVSVVDVSVVLVIGVFSIIKKYMSLLRIIEKKNYVLKNYIYSQIGGKGKKSYVRLYFFHLHNFSRFSQ